MDRHFVWDVDRFVYMYFSAVCVECPYLVLSGDPLVSGSGARSLLGRLSLTYPAT